MAFFVSVSGSWKAISGACVGSSMSRSRAWPFGGTGKRSCSGVLGSMLKEKRSPPGGAIIGPLKVAGPGPLVTTDVGEIGGTMGG
jgi:hypothetical protein